MSAIPSNRKLQYILAVARDLHFRKAAEKLHVAQPSLSRQVRECEEEIGFEIFRRDNHFVSLTKAGRAFVKDIEQVLKQSEADLERAIERGQAISRQVASEWSIAHSPFASMRMRHLALKIQERLFPNLDLRLRIFPTSELLKAIESEVVHAGITFAPVDHSGLGVIRIRSDRWFAVVPANSRFGKLKTVSLGELKGLRLISNGADRTHPAMFQQLAAECAANGFRFKFVAEVTSPAEAFDLVQSSVGYVLLPEGACEDIPRQVRAIHVIDITPLETVFVHRTNDTEFATSFVEGLRAGLSDSGAYLEKKRQQSPIEVTKRKPPVSTAKDNRYPAQVRSTG